MRLPLEAWSERELDDAYDSLSPAIATARAAGRFGLGAQLLALRAEINAHVIQIQTAKAVANHAQLSLVPRGAYEPPAA